MSIYTGKLQIAIRELPEGPYLQQLWVLNLSGNGFQYVPPALAMAVSLQQLDMSDQGSPPFFNERDRVIDVGWMDAGLAILANLPMLHMVNLSPGFLREVDPEVVAALRQLEGVRPNLVVQL